MSEIIKSAAAPYAEAYTAEDDAPLNTDGLTPEAARRLERFAELVDRFGKAAASGVLSPPVSAAGTQR